MEVVALRFAGVKPSKRPPPQKSGQDQQSSALQSVISSESAATEADPPRWRLVLFPPLMRPPPPPFLQTPVEIMAVWELHVWFRGFPALPRGRTWRKANHKSPAPPVWPSMPCRPLLSGTRGWARPCHARDLSSLLIRGSCTHSTTVSGLWGTRWSSLFETRSRETTPPGPDDGAGYVVRRAVASREGSTTPEVMGWWSVMGGDWIGVGGCDGMDGGSSGSQREKGGFGEMGIPFRFKLDALLAPRLFSIRRAAPTQLAAQPCRNLTHRLAAHVHSLLSLPFSV